MKSKNIKTWAEARFSHGGVAVAKFCTDKALSNWANRQFKIDNNYILL